MSKKSIGDKYEYELNQRLGSGAFAEVYKGRNKVTGEQVAIKVIKRSILSKYGDDMLNQIHQEIKVLQSLTDKMKTKLCPFIIKQFECLETSNNIYIVLEMCNQGTLLDYLKKKNKRLPEEEAIRILYHMTNALAFLAENGMAHRDIKPENVFIKDNIYKLGDFGFAGQKQLYQTHLGTYPYMAPEFFNSNQYNSAVDIWALGCVFHEMLFGEIYFIGNSQYEVTMKILNKAYDIRPDQVCSPVAQDILKKMIEKDQKKRITAKEMLEHPIFDQIKNSAETREIFENERKYMEANFWSQSQKAQISQEQQQAQLQQERERLEREQREREQAEQIAFQKQQEQLAKEVQEYSQKIDNIVDGINSMRNGVYLLLQLTEYLQKEFINECRYDIFYIMKQCIIHMQKMKEKLDEQSIFSEKDNIEFKGIDAQAWKSYYENVDDKYQKQREEVAHEKAIVLKSYIDYFNYINTHTQMNYPEHLQNLQQITNLNFQEYIPYQLYAPQMHSTISYFSQVVTEDKDRVRQMVLWLYLAANYDLLFQGRLVDIGRFIEAKYRNDAQGMKQAIQFQ